MFGHAGPDFSSPGALPQVRIPNNVVAILHGNNKPAKARVIIPRIVNSVLQVSPHLSVSTLILRHGILPASQVNPVLFVALHDVSLLSDGSIISQHKATCKGLFRVALLLLLLSYTRTVHIEQYRLLPRLYPCSLRTASHPTQGQSPTA